MLQRLPLIVAALLVATTAYTTSAAGGPWYSIPLLAILVAHELGHWLMCRRYGVDSSLPILLPMPVGPFGTLGGVIAIRDRFPDRRALFDMGAAGPLAGLFLALPITAYGLSRSVVIVAPAATESLVLGESLLFQLIRWAVMGPLPEGSDVLLHPTALAGWFGLFLTGLNLLPIGQLDGGHVVYAWRGPSQASRVTRATLLAFVGLTLISPVWILVLLLVWRFVSRHPPTMNDLTPLDRPRSGVATLTMIVFVLTFTPIPIAGFPSLF